MGFIQFLICGLTAVSALSAEKETTALLVDKKTNQLHVTHYVSGKYVTQKTYHATLGLVKGDKEEEADQKTPEGIYIFNNKQHAPKIQAKLGVMALNLNYPNAYDQIAGRKGFGIMLHGTNEPNRLKQSYDSQGCVVVKNEELVEIEKSIRVGLTPILIFPELTDEYLAPGQNPSILHFFESWIKAWESKNIDSYIEHYHSGFSAQHMDKAKWKTFKAGLNFKYATIKIGPESVRYYKHPKYWMITFSQNYHSTLKGGGNGHKSRGTKILFVAEEAGQPKIIAETYTTAMW